MRTLAAGLQDHLDSGATTLCWCWRITRNDAVAFGFTDHDRDLAFDGTTFEAASGFTGSEISGAVGLNVDTLDVDGALKSDRLNEADLAAGLFDNALIEIYRVNWADPAMRVLMRYGNLGEVSRGAHHFRCEVRGLAHELQQPKGRMIQYGCDADLGDARCGVNVNQAVYAANGGVASLGASPRRFMASGLGAYATNWFTRGLLTWDSGANDGTTSEVKLHAKARAGPSSCGRGRPKPSRPATFRVTAGCDKQFATCRAKFANTANFRGFPHVSGNDFMLRVASRSDRNDGGRVR
ncbi:beta tubulin [Methyloceanibacter methanicus]|uniref:Beta tubulin n=1 Tax=Methyloceanibacter methanicus TaxID=1774968 RepID=A0A1E3VZV0_9HYPH|nr:DUF2163 domain-containing protein [Methyloceanibacter methanicus]ODR98426.1 beta tubulin [Methyloceanibacter methanicus]